MRLKERVLLVERYFHNHGGATVLIARFVTFLGTLACPVAGMSRMNYKRFLTFEFIGSAAWALAFGLLGYFFGRSYNTIMSVFNYIGNGLLVVILALGIGAYVVYAVKEHRKVEAELDEIEEEEEEQIRKGETEPG